MFASLDRVDGEMERQNGQRRFVQTDHRDADEIAASRELSILFALSRVLGPRHVENTEAQVVYFLHGRPPEFLIEAIASAGGRVLIGALGAHPRTWSDIPASLRARPRPVEQILNEAMAALARRTASEKGLPLDWDGLGRFEEELLATWGHGDEEDEIDVDLGDDEEEEEEEEGGEKRDADGGEARWTRIVQLASFTGELLRQNLTGRWLVKPDSGELVPLFFEASHGNKSAVMNLVGKAVKMKANGQEDSLRFLATTAITMLRG